MGGAYQRFAQTFCMVVNHGQEKCKALLGLA